MLSLGFLFVQVHADGDEASAGPPECDPSDPQRCSMPLKRGEVAPYAGQLLTPKLAVSLGQAAEHCDEAIALEVSRTSSASVVEIRHARAVAKIDARALARERDLYKNLYESKPEAAWYEHPAFIVPVSVLATLGAVYVATRFAPHAESAR